MRTIAILVFVLFFTSCNKEDATPSLTDENCESVANVYSDRIIISPKGQTSNGAILCLVDGTIDTLNEDNLSLRRESGYPSDWFVYDCNVAILIPEIAPNFPPFIEDSLFSQIVSTTIYIEYGQSLADTITADYSLKQDVCPSALVFDTLQVKINGVPAFLGGEYSDDFELNFTTNHSLR